MDGANVVQVQVVRGDVVVHAVARTSPNARDYRAMEEECVRWGARPDELRTVTRDGRLYDHRFNPEGLE
jgi:hypothetical protein